MFPPHEGRYSNEASQGRELSPKRKDGYSSIKAAPFFYAILTAVMPLSVPTKMVVPERVGVAKRLVFPTFREVMGWPVFILSA